MDNNIRVAARIRPENKREKSMGKNQATFEIDSTGSQLDFKSGTNGKKRTFALDRIFAVSSNQKSVFEKIAIPVIENLFKGYNGTIFAYGQTGSGKTYSMFGPDLRDQTSKLRGIVPRSAHEIFERLVSKSCEDVEEVTIRVSYIEIYNEKINDLLDRSKTNLQVRESPMKGIFVAGCTEMNVNCEEDIFDFLDIGAENRSVASTGMNDQSSRSHSIYTIKMQQHLTSGVTRISKLNFVDLAGSENVKKTHATGKVFKEAKNINKSLSALGLCIKALTSSQKSKHIPFRDSKLTRILQESLGGNTRTTLLVCLSPHSDNFEESLSTLRFATQAKSIKTKAKVNERHSPEMMEKIIESLQQEMRKLKQQLRRSSTIAFRRDGDVVKITNRGTQTMMMVKTDDGENEEEDEETKNSLLQQTGLPSLRDAMQSIVPTYRNRHGLFSRLVKLHTPRNDMKEDIGEDTNDDDDYDDDDDDDDDDVFGNIEQVLRLKQENSLLRHRILDLEQSIREQKEEEGEEENEIKESKSFTINQDAEARIRELEEKLRMSESSRQRLERLQRNSSKRRAANRISRRSLLALREAEKKTKSAKELYSTARSKLRKTNSPLLREAMLTAKVVSKMRRLSSSPGASSVSSVDSTTDSSISSSNVTPPSTPPHGEGGWNRRRSSLGDT